MNCYVWDEYEGMTTFLTMPEALKYASKLLEGYAKAGDSYAMAFLQVGKVLARPAETPEGSFEMCPTAEWSTDYPLSQVFTGAEVKSLIGRP